MSNTTKPKPKSATSTKAPRFTPSGSSAFDEILRRSKELVPQPVARPASPNPFHGLLDKVMAEALDLSPAAVEAARVELARARQGQLQQWLAQRAPLLRNRGLDCHLVGIDQLELVCKSCGTSWLIPAGIMPPDTDPLLQCPNFCNRIG